MRILLSTILKLNRKGLVIQLHHIRNELLSTHAEHHNEIDYIPEETPVFIICRDRVSVLIDLVTALETMGCRNIFLVDNGSNYPALLSYFKTTPYQVLPLDMNVGHTSPWDKGIVSLFAKNRYYIVTDPDVVPAEDCPPNTLEHLHDVLIRYSSFVKIGLGLKIDDLPDHYALRQQVIEWEGQFWKAKFASGLYEAGVDTTFALYRPNTVYQIHPSLRIGEPYVARHLPWYTDSTLLTDEDQYYRIHANASINSWDSDILKDRYSKEMSIEN